MRHNGGAHVPQKPGLLVAVFPHETWNFDGRTTALISKSLDSEKRSRRSDSSVLKACPGSGHLVIAGPEGKRDIEPFLKGAPSTLESPNV